MFEIGMGVARQHVAKSDVFLAKEIRQQAAILRPGIGPPLRMPLLIAECKTLADVEQVLLPEAFHEPGGRNRGVVQGEQHQRPQKAKGNSISGQQPWSMPGQRSYRTPYQLPFAEQASEGWHG